MQIITGFHAIEEVIKSGVATMGEKPRICYAKKGPRVKQILLLAEEAHIPILQCSEKELENFVVRLPESSREHRGIVLLIEGQSSHAKNVILFDDFIARKRHGQKLEKNEENSQNSLVLILDSITDPHNFGAILRNCDQFGVDLVIVSEHNSPKESDVIARSSAGAHAWVKKSVVTNLSRAVDMLKDSGYWIYGADANGEDISKTDISGNCALILGSEGSGISRLLRSKCDKIVSIQTAGKLDSLNVSVASGILLYEIRKKN